MTQTLSVVSVDFADRTETVVWGFDFDGGPDASVSGVAASIESNLGRRTTVRNEQIWLEGDHARRLRTFLEEEEFGLAETHELPPDLERSDHFDPDDIKAVRREARMHADTAMMTGICDPETAASFLVYDDVETRQAATEALARSGSAPIEPLLGVLQDDDETVRSNALQAIVRALDRNDSVDDSRRLVDRIVPHLADSEPHCRWMAISAIAAVAETHADDLDADSILEPIVDRLDDRPKIRMTAAIALGHLDDERALDPLTSLESRAEDRTESHARALEAIEKITRD